MLEIKQNKKKHLLSKQNKKFIYLLVLKMAAQGFIVKENHRHYVCRPHVTSCNLSCRQRNTFFNDIRKTCLQNKRSEI